VLMKISKKDIQLKKSKKKSKIIRSTSYHHNTRSQIL